MSSNQIAAGVLENFGNEDNPPRVFLNELLYLTLSQITFRRRLFPKNTYTTKSFYNSLVEVVDPKCGLENVLKFCNALGSIMQAMDAEYLRSMVFVLNECGSPAEALEAYSVTFYYNSPSAVCRLSQQHTDLDLTFESEIVNRKDRVIQLLTQIQCLSFHKFRDATKEYFVTFHIFFYENTPRNYSLPYFGPCPPSLRGAYQRPEAKRPRLEEGDGSGRAEELPVEMVPPFNGSILAGESESLFNFDSQQQVNQAVGSANVTRTNNVSEESDKDKESYPVRCPCRDSDEDGLMIACVYCQTWQHGICFRVISQDVAPEKHVCVDCAKEHDDLCTDVELKSEFHTPESIEMICAFRRALTFCLYETRISLKRLQTLLGCYTSKARKIVDQLKELKVLKTTKGRYSVVKETLEEVLILEFGDGAKALLEATN